MTECSTEFLFPFHPKRKLVADFEGGEITSDAGLLPIREFDQRIGFTSSLAEAFRDGRQAGKVDHSRREIFRHRIYGLIAGYEDARDADSTRHDPLFQALAGDRGAGDLLASQSTVTRWENDVTEEEIEAIYRKIREQYLKARRRAPKRLYLDADASGGVCHGHQQLTFFNTYYDERIYKPLYIFDSDWGYPLAGALRPGNEGDASRCLIYLDEVLTDLRRKWKNTRFIFRGDSGFAAPEIYEYCEIVKIDYLLGWNGPHPPRERMKKPLADLVRRYEKTGKPQRRFLTIRYRADGWDRSRKVCVKLEATENGTNLRFIITSLRGSAKDLFAQYEQRGDAENNIKEMKCGLFAHRFSCHRFDANALRLAVATAAYAFMVLFSQKILRGTELESAQVQTLRVRLFKLGARIRLTVRRVCVHLSSSWPSRQLFRTIYRKILALPPPVTA
jgi:hypothetical protein